MVTYIILSSLLIFDAILKGPASISSKSRTSWFEFGDTEDNSNESTAKVMFSWESDTIQISNPLRSNENRRSRTDETAESKTSKVVTNPLGISIETNKDFAEERISAITDNDVL